MEAHLAAPVHFCPARCFSKLKSDAYRFCTQAMELVRGVALARLSMPCLTCQVLHVCAMCAWCKLPWRQAFQNTHAPSAGAYGAGAHAMLGSSTLAGTGAACGPAPALTPPLSLVLGASAPGESIPLDSRATVAVWAAIGSDHFSACAPPLQAPMERARTPCWAAAHWPARERPAALHLP